MHLAAARKECRRRPERHRGKNLIGDAHIFPYRREIHKAANISHHKNRHRHHQAADQLLLAEAERLRHDKTHAAERRVARRYRTCHHTKDCEHRTHATEP